MKCPNCKGLLKKVSVSIHNSTRKIPSYQCLKCDYYSFDIRNSPRVVQDLAGTRVDSLAKIIWDYHLLHHQLRKADLILVLGSNDPRVAEYGAELFLKGWAPLIMFSGGIAHNADSLKTSWRIAEADYFAKIAIKKGVPKEKVIIENKSTNTGDNIFFSRKILQQKKISVSRIILVQKPYMERRAYATCKKRWPRMNVFVTSPPLTFEKYPTKYISKEKLINLIVGDLQRIRSYAQKGFQIRQHVPREVWRAYEELVKRGYTKHIYYSA